jgi:asparagine synthetase B (glutamine-hydrolysing)
MLYGPLAPSAVRELIAPPLRRRTTLPRRISDLIEAPRLGEAGRLETYSAADASTDSAAAGVLAKIGKASRAAGLDLFEPYLSRPVVEYFWRLDPGWKLQGSFPRRLANRVPSRDTKLILRRLLARRVPRHVTERTKQGFEPPLAAWLRQRLDGRTARHLCGSLLAGTDWLNEAFVDRVIAEHVAGAADHRYLLFALASLDQWHRAFIVGRGERPSWSWSDALREAGDRRSESRHEEAQRETG